MIELLDERYIALTETTTAASTSIVAAAGGQGGGLFQYQDFSSTKPPEFNEVKDSIIAMRWLSDLESFFFTCSCL